MDFDKFASRLAAEYVGQDIVREVRTRTAGEIRHIRDRGPQRRKNVKDHDYSGKDLKKLTKVLWQISVALGHLSSATNTFTRVKSVRISPDGVLGGAGYDKPIKELRRELYGAVEALSSIQDTLYDEVNGPHWKPKVEKLPPSDQEDVEEMIEDVDEIREDPASYGEERYERDVEDDNDSGSDDREEESAFDLAPVMEDEPEEEEG